MRDQRGAMLPYFVSFPFFIQLNSALNEASLSNQREIPRYLKKGLISTRRVNEYS